MTLIKSISGIRGTIGGKPGESLSPIDIVKYSAAFGTWIRKRQNKTNIQVVIGRDARTSGNMVNNLLISTLRSLAIDIIDLGLASTPTVEIAVIGTGANGGIIITASHNPANWNALKLLNEKGEFLSSDDGNEVLEIAASENFTFADIGSMGNLRSDNSWGKRHIKQILQLNLVDVKTIKSAGLKVAIDCINSVGGIILPDLLERLGVNNVYLINSAPDGNFAHNPEPLPENLQEISRAVINEKADVGFVVDPDVDRLAIVCEDGNMFGEEYTLVAISDYVLSSTPGNTVSNFSSTRSLKEITEKHGCRYFSSAVGEVNVVEEMKRNNAIIGGEGNGGIIYPELHYGRDALVGIALFLSYLAKSKLKCSDIRKFYPQYVIAKKRLALDPVDDIYSILELVKKHYAGHEFNEVDGLRIEHKYGWVHIRKSNTEPILRIYAEGRTKQEAEKLADDVIRIVNKI